MGKERVKMINLGDMVRERFTGFEGVATAETKYLNGCNRIQVQPLELKDGIPQEGIWIDKKQLSVKKLKTTKKETEETGGPMEVPSNNMNPPNY